MAEDNDSGEKTHEPTARRRQQFQEEGNIPKSQDFLGVVVILAGFGSLFIMSGVIGTEFFDYAKVIYSFIPDNSLDLGDFKKLLMLTFEFMWSILALPLFVIWLAVLIAGLIQSRFIIPKEPIKFKPEKLDPIKGAKEKFFSAQPIVELVKGVLKLFLLGWVVYLGLKEEFDLLPAMINVDPSYLPHQFIAFAKIVFWRAVAVGIIVAVLDYSYSWYKIQQQMMMTHEEIKEEMKQTEGDPYMRNFRRQRQYEIAMGVALKEVPDADVVVTNPTHFAVALRYRRDEADAPKVVARGVDFLAFRIREIAKANDVSVIENPPLARGLYYKTREGQEIPPEFYSAVAEILAAVYKRRYGGRQPAG